MTIAGGGGIFVSYRRQESRDFAGRLYDRLADRFGEGQVFIDVDTIEPGVDFAEEIFRAVAACQVLLAVIGPGWLTAADEQGARRLDDPEDIVRLEIEAALARDVRVIPILVQGAVMPTRQDLPGSLAGLARRNDLFAEDVVWHQGGRSQLTGEYRGRDAVYEFFGKLIEVTHGTFHMELEAAFANDELGVALVVASSSVNGRSVTVREAHIVRMRDGKVAEFWYATTDQYEFDEMIG